MQLSDPVELQDAALDEVAEDDRGALRKVPVIEVNDYSTCQLDGRITNRRVLENLDITRYGRLLKKTICCIIRLWGMFGMVQNSPTGCGNNLPVLLRSICFAKIEKSELFVFAGLLSISSGIWEPEKCEPFFFEPFFDFFRNLGTREVYSLHVVWVRSRYSSDFPVNGL